MEPDQYTYLYGWVIVTLPIEWVRDVIAFLLS